MNFDVAIIGGGLAGLTCAIALQSQGKRCVIINNGQAAMDFASGSFDLLTPLHVNPQQSAVENLTENLTALCKHYPHHPYALMGAETVIRQAVRFEKLAAEWGLSMKGGLAAPHARLTGLGGLRQSWLSPTTVPTVPTMPTASPFPHRRIAVLGIEGYHDFQPSLLADNLKRQPTFAHCEFHPAFLNLPELDNLRLQAREFRSVNIAQALQHKIHLDSLAAEIRQAAQQADAVFLPACFGLETAELLTALCQQVGLPLFELPTMPPSLLGMRQHHQLRRCFEQWGGVMLNGDAAVKANIDHHHVTALYTRIQQDEPVYAKHFVLASGSFFSKGLQADFEKIREPVFDADIVGEPGFVFDHRQTWTKNRFSAAQPYQSAGVAVNAACQVQKCGRFFDNLFAVGNVIGGFNALQLGCGSGVAVITALTAADRILADKGENS